MNIITVKNCNDCVFVGYHDTIFNSDEDDCYNHCNAVKEKTNLYRNNNPKSPDFTKIIHPKWCPLLTEEINVVLL